MQPLRHSCCAMPAPARLTSVAETLGALHGDREVAHVVERTGHGVRTAPVREPGPGGDVVVGESGLHLARELDAADPVHARDQHAGDGELRAGQGGDARLGRIVFRGQGAGDERVAGRAAQLQPAQPAEERAVGVLGAQPRQLPAALLHRAADAEAHRLEGRLAHVHPHRGHLAVAERLHRDAHSGEGAEVVDALLGEREGERAVAVAAVDAGGAGDGVGGDLAVAGDHHLAELETRPGVDVEDDVGATRLRAPPPPCPAPRPGRTRAP